MAVQFSGSEVCPDETDSTKIVNQTVLNIPFCFSKVCMIEGLMMLFENRALPVGDECMVDHRLTGFDGKPFGAMEAPMSSPMMPPMASPVSPPVMAPTAAAPTSAGRAALGFLGASLSLLLAIVTVEVIMA